MDTRPIPKLQRADSPQETAFFFVGDHPVMDLLNTVARPAVDVVDLWQRDSDVQRWLAQTGLLKAQPQPGKPGELLRAARSLREEVRLLVSERQKGRRLDFTRLNRFLAASRSFCELIRARNNSLTVVRRYEAATPAQLLAPLAETAADFLVSTDFNLVRRCEGEGCVLWFYDRTRSHRRRWCSMEICGNRNKVAAFRTRLKDDESVVEF